MRCGPAWCLSSDAFWLLSHFGTRCLLSSVRAGRWWSALCKAGTPVLPLAPLWRGKGSEHPWAGVKVPVHHAKGVTREDVVYAVAGAHISGRELHTVVGVCWWDGKNVTLDIQNQVVHLKEWQQEGVQPEKTEQGVFGHHGGRVSECSLPCCHTEERSQFGTGLSGTGLGGHTWPCQHFLQVSWTTWSSQRALR